MSLLNLLLEGRKSDFLNKFKSKFDKDTMMNILRASESLASNHKFLDFMGKVLDSNVTPDDLEKLKTTINDFSKFQKNLDRKDINQYDSVKDIRQAIEKHENRIRRNIKEIKGADIVYEDDEFTVVTPKTHEASCYYGSGTKWCTTTRSSDAHFNRYNDDGKLFYFLNKKLPTSSPFYKVALLQKFDGHKTYYDTLDNPFKRGWIFGEEKLERMLGQIDNYMNSQYAREIELFMDKARARQELERRRQERERRRVEELRQRMEYIKENNLWDVDNPNKDDLANYANAVWKAIVNEWGYGEVGDQTVYDLLPATDRGDYGLYIFEWIDEDDNHRGWYGVGTEEEVHEAAVDKLEQDIDSNGLVYMFREDYLKSFIDGERAWDYFEDMYRDELFEEPEIYFSEDERTFADWQIQWKENTQKRIEKLEREMEEEEDYTKREEIEELIDELETEINELEPEGPPTDEAYEQRLNEIKNEYLQDPFDKLNELGVLNEPGDIERFVDVRALIENAIDLDGVGHFLNFYDGIAYEEEIDGQWYTTIMVEE